MRSTSLFSLVAFSLASWFVLYGACRWTGWLEVGWYAPRFPNNPIASPDEIDHPAVLGTLFSPLLRAETLVRVDPQSIPLSGGLAGATLVLAAILRLQHRALTLSPLVSASTVLLCFVGSHLSEAPWAYYASPIGYAFGYSLPSAGPTGVWLTVPLVILTLAAVPARRREPGRCSGCRYVLQPCQARCPECGRLRTRFERSDSA